MVIKPRGKCKALSAWDRVCKPKNKGGLAILDLSVFDDAQMIKFLYKFFNRSEASWVKFVWSAYYNVTVPTDDDRRGSFWWRDLVKLIPAFKTSSKGMPGNEDSFSFWQDAWASEPLSSRFPRAFSFAIDKSITLSNFALASDHLDHFALPFSNLAFQEYQQIMAYVAHTHLEPHETDLWLCQWGSGTFTSKLYYQHHFPRIHTDSQFNWIWKNRCVPKIKGFMWLLACDRLNTRDLMDHRHCNRDAILTCACCTSNARETRDHLFFKCDFSLNYWRTIGLDWTSQIGRAHV